MTAKRPLIFFTIALFVIATFIFFTPRLGEAQTQEDLSVCSALAQEALSQSAANCGGLETNAACYGYNRVSVLFHEEVDENLFSQPADRAPVAQLHSIETSAYDQTSEFWGVAVMKLQANIPNTLPGQSVTFILMGETQVQNAVPSADAVLPSDITVEVQTSARGNVRSRPSLRANILTVAEAGQTLEADAVDETGAWLRVVANGTPGWINRVALLDVDASSLPVITGESFAPMQAFYLKTRFGRPECDQAPSTLLVQGPKNIAIDLRVNGADITISSTVLIRTVDGDTLELIVLDGQAVVHNLTVRAGYKSTVPLEPADITLDGGQTESLAVVAGDWEECVPLTDEELTALQTFVNIPASLLSYPIVLPDRATGDCSQFGVVTPSQGQNTSSVAGVDCRNLRPTSPLGGASYGPNTFYWDGAPGATSYRINLYNADGQFAGSVNTPGPETSFSLDTAIAGGGFSFSWEVQALVNGEVACTSSRVTMGLGAPPAPVQGSGPVEVPLQPTPTL